MMTAILSTGATLISCQCTAFAKDGRGHIAYLELVSQSMQCLRAFWADIVKDGFKGNYNYSGVCIRSEQDEIAIVTGNSRLMKMERRDKDGTARMILIDERFHRTSREMIFQSQWTKDHFKDFLANHTDVPFIEDWISGLWKFGSIEKLIIPMKSNGVNCYQLVKNDEKWQNALRHAAMKPENIELAA